MQHGGFNAAARPLYSHGLVILNTEGGQKLLAVRPDGSGDVTRTHVAWTYGKATPTRPSQLIVGDHLYMVNDAGIVSCLDVASGEAAWTERMGGRHSASPICSDGRIYCFDEDGATYVLAADPTGFRLLAKNTLIDAAWRRRPWRTTPSSCAPKPICIAKAALRVAVSPG